MERSKASVTWAIFVLALVHLVGLVGLHLEDTRDWFIQLVPYNLLLSALILGWFHRPWSLNFGIIAIVIFWAGYLVELVGVKTGVLFGPYHYDQALGFKIGGVPPLIGLNWLLLTYSTGVIAMQSFHRLWVRILVASVLLVGLDLLIEPMAIRFEFWTWETSGGEIPIQNYLAWFVIAILMQVGFQLQDQRPNNPLAYPFFLIEVGFFGIFLLVEHAF